MFVASITLFSSQKVEAYQMEFFASDGMGGNTSITSNTLDAVAPTLTTTSSSITLYVEGGPLDGTPYLLKSSSPATAYSGTTAFPIDSGFDNQYITGLTPGDYTFRARLSNTQDGGTTYLYAEIPVRVVATSATVNVSLNSCPTGTTYGSSTGNNGTQPGGTFTFTPASNGTQVTISVTTPVDYVFDWTTPSSQIAYQGGSYNFTGLCRQQTPPVTADIKANGSDDPITITSGQSASLTWSSTNVRSCSSADFSTGNVTSNSTGVSVSPTATKTYNLTCTSNDGRTGIDSVTVNVVSAPAPTVTVTASPASISSGGSSTVSWSSTNATSCASNWWSGSSSTSGSVTVSPSVTTNYTKTCSNASGSNTGSATVSVTPGASANLTANPTTMTKGNGTILNWTSTNTSSCSGVGFNTSGATSNTVSWYYWIAPTQTTTYTLNCISSVGGPNPSSSATVTVTAPTVATIILYAGLAQGGGTVNPGNFSNTGQTPTPIYVTPNPTNGTTYTVTPYNVSGYTASVEDGQTGVPGASALLFPGDSKYFSVIYTSSFNYSLSNSGATTVPKGGSGQNTITETLVSGTSQPVTLAVSGVPAGVSATLSTCSPVNPTCTSVITFTVPANTPAGDYNVTVTGSPLSKTTNLTLRVVNNPAITSTCVASPSSALVGQTVTWTANASGGTPPYTYSWSGSGIPTDPAPSSASFGITYSTIGQKTAQVVVTDSLSSTGSCPAPGGTVQINFNPQFKEF